MIYDIFIGSLIFIYDLLFTLIYRSFGNPAITIIVLSIVINLIVLPLYQRADTVQIPLKQHAVSDRTACCSASSGTE